MLMGLSHPQGSCPAHRRRKRRARAGGWNGRRTELALPELGIEACAANRGTGSDRAARNVQPHGASEALELDGADLDKGQPQAVGGIHDFLADDNLPLTCVVGNPRGGVDGPAKVVAFLEQDGSGVQAYVGSERHRIRQPTRERFLTGLRQHPVHLAPAQKQPEGQLTSSVIRTNTSGSWCAGTHRGSRFPTGPRSKLGRGQPTRARRMGKAGARCVAAPILATAPLSPGARALMMPPNEGGKGQQSPRQRGGPRTVAQRPSR
jgi:hypothetical protein